MTPNDTQSQTDARFMKMAIELARQGEGFVEPNPMVGCVIVRDGEVIGQGYHRKFGGPHAEVNAIASLSDRSDARGATAYVSLEPCCHHGKTPPCTGALIDAGVSRVVAAMQDPFPKVAGGGLQALRDQGIDVVVGVLQSEARALIAPFRKHIETGMPWVIAKWAMTMDGRIATKTGDSKWITGERSRAEVHRLRSRVDAVIVGMGTVQADDPTLTTRLPDGETIRRTATRVVFCDRRLPELSTKLVQTSKITPTLVFATKQTPIDAIERLREHGVEVVIIDAADRSDMMMPAFENLGKRGCANVMIEGGAELFSSFFSAGQIDEAHVYVGAKAFGSAAAPGPIAGDGVNQVAQAWHFKTVDVRQIDDDIRIIYRRES